MAQRGARVHLMTMASDGGLALALACEMPGEIRYEIREVGR